MKQKIIFMRIGIYILLVCLMIGSSALHAQIASEGKQARILILLDGSSSMTEVWNNDTRFATASRIILGLMDSVYKVNKDVEFSLRVFGHQHTVSEKNCFDTKREVMFSKDNMTQMNFRLSSLHPLGVSPIAYSLKQAAENDFVQSDDYAYSLVLITDGGESCGGDICNVTETLLAKKIFFKPYIVSLVDYAPLQQQYECLGNYLTVTTGDDIPKAIGTIVASYKNIKPMFTTRLQEIKMDTLVPGKFALVAIDGLPQPERIRDTMMPVSMRQAIAMIVTMPPLPPFKKVTVDKILTFKEPDMIAGMNIVPIRQIAVKNYVKTFDPIEHDVLPQPKPIDDINGIAIARPTTVSTAAPIPIAKTVQPNKMPKAEVPVPEPPKPPVVKTPVKETYSRLPMNTHVKQMTVRFYTDNFKPLKFISAVMTDGPKPVVQKPKPDTVVMNIPPKKPKPDTVGKIFDPSKAPPKTVKADPPKTTTPITPLPVSNPTELPYKVESTIAAETSVQIFFTDGKGKFFSTTPQVLILDPVTNGTVQKFYRTIDASGNPDLQKNIPPGTYNIAITGKKNFIVKNIVVAANSNNKILIPVSQGTLSFKYRNNPDRPVEEFFAVVKRIIDVGPTIKQKCTAVLKYEPGEYHIEVNTLPVKKSAVALDFGDETVIEIDEPGYVYFTNTDNIGKVSLYYPLGDQFMRFHGIDVTGNLEAQKVKLQPGFYEARFMRNAGKPNAAITSVRFQVKSNEATELELR